MKESNFNRKKPQILINLFFIICTLLSVVPFLLIISISFSNENDVMRYGYSLIPKHINLTAYKLAFANGMKILHAYGITIYSSVIGTVLSLVLMSLCGYALSQEKFRYRRFLNMYVLIPMMIGGGLIPTYIINTHYLHLSNNMSVYVVLGLVSSYTIFVFKAFFMQIPKSLIEAARIDGASEKRIFINIVLPSSAPVFASVGFMALHARWNDWQTSLYYITDNRLVTLQYLLQQVLQEAEMMKTTMVGSGDTSELPTATLKFAVCVISTLPATVFFPFFQKYFTKGMVVGSVKG